MSLLHTKCIRIHSFHSWSIGLVHTLDSSVLTKPHIVIQAKIAQEQWTTTCNIRLMAHSTVASGNRRQGLDSTLPKQTTTA